MRLWGREETDGARMWQERAWGGGSGNRPLEAWKPCRGQASARPDRKVYEDDPARTPEHLEATLLRSTLRLHRG